MKLINNTRECGYKVLVHVGCNCTHPEGLRISCHYDAFPFSCPLQDGIIRTRRNRWRDGEMTVTIPKRRNRKDCRYYDKKGIYSCNEPDAPLDCIGVTCGYFKTK